MEYSQVLKEISFLKDYITEERYSKIKKVLNYRTNHITMVLEDIYHSHNASAIVRTCDCFGVQNLHVIENVKKNRINKGVTQGSGKWITISKYKKGNDNTSECIANLKEKGYLIVATALVNDSEISLEELPVEEKKIALCFGCEELGLSDKALALADYALRIPMYGFTQSFNISVVAAMCLQVLIKKMHKSNVNWHLTEDEKLFLKHKWIKSSVKNCEMILSRLT